MADTPIQRAAEAMCDYWEDTRAIASNETISRTVLSAALDGDGAAKAMFDAFRQVKGGDTAWFALPNHSQDFWRDVAEALRASILGEA